MEILRKPFGSYGTNCYILKGKNGDLVIDPGENSYDYIMQNTNKILAVLNTHGHFDHVLGDYKLQQNGAKIYIHKDDAFMLSNDPFGYLDNTLIADVCVEDEKSIKFNEFEVKFLHFPGHTPGSCMLLINGVIFSGDVVFKGSIGRYDFPFSNQSDMKKSLSKILQIDKNFTLYPGHGASTNLETEKTHLKYFLSII